MHKFTIHGLTPLVGVSLATIFLLLPAATTRAQVDSDLRTAVGAWVSAHQPQIVKELVDLLSIPNVAADRPNIRRNAEHLRGMLAARGFKAELLETGGNPLVYGELAVPGATRTLLLYSHYDGQPVDAEGVEAGGSLYAGAADDESRPRRHRYSVGHGREAVRARVAALRALGIRRQGADRGDLRRDRRAHRVLAPPDLERARHPRRRGGGQLAEPGARDREVPRQAARGRRWSSSTARFTRAAGPRSPTARAASSRSTSPSSGPRPASTAATTGTGCRTPPSGLRRCSRR